MSEYVERCSTFTESRTITKEYVHTWKINNFKELHPGIGENKAVMGKIDGKDVWVFRLYPDGHDSDSKDYISLFVGFEKALIGINDSNYLFVIYILDKNQMEHELYKWTTGKDGKFIEKLIKQNYVHDEKNEVLPDGNLIMRFKIYFTREIDDNSKSMEITSLCTSYPKHKGFANMFNQEKFSDVKITVANEVFWAYKGILANESPVFAAMFEHEMKESKQNTIEITDIDHEVVQEMLRFIYVGKVNNVETLASDLFIAADKYELEQLKKICEVTLINGLNAETVVELLVFADKCGAKMLKEKAIDFFKSHAKEIIKTEKFKADSSSLLPVLSEIIESLTSSL